MRGSSAKTWEIRKSCSPSPTLADERLDGPLAEPDRPPILDPRRVTLVLIEGVGGAPELVGGFLHGQQTVATCRSPQREEESDDLGENAARSSGESSPTRAGRGRPSTVP